MSVISADDGLVEIVEDLSRREVRALTERLVVLDCDAPGLFTVYSEEGTRYSVNIQNGGACTCPDVQFSDPDEGCKHQHAAQFLAGDREIPSWVIRENINAKMATTGVGEAA